MVRRRHIFYIEGYDPQGPKGYHSLFVYAAKRFQKLWPIKLEIGALELDTPHLAHWNVEAATDDWQVSTRYDFLRLEAPIAKTLARPTWQLGLLSLKWALQEWTSGRLIRIFRIGPRYALLLMILQTILTWWIGLSLTGGALVGVLLAKIIAAPLAASIAAALVAAALLLFALQPMVNILYGPRVMVAWLNIWKFAAGEPSGFDAPLEAYARAIVAAARANEADEIVVMGHCFGGMITPSVMARALELDPDLGRHGPKVTMMTLGAVTAACALHPRATRLRDDLKRIAIEPSIQWIDVQSRKDVMVFFDVDPVSAVGIDAGPQKCNPAIWKVRMRDLFAPGTYNKERWNFYRIHFQYVMGNDVRATYDYVMLCCSPLGAHEWMRDKSETVQGFLRDLDRIDPTRPQLVPLNADKDAVIPWDNAVKAPLT